MPWSQAYSQHTTESTELFPIYVLMVFSDFGEVDFNQQGTLTATTDDIDVPKVWRTTYGFKPHALFQPLFVYDEHRWEMWQTNGYTEDVTATLDRKAVGTTH